MQDETLDLRGLKCPLPALMVRRALARVVPGTTLECWVDDPMASVDIPYMCHVEGFDVVAIVHDGDCVRLTLKRPR